MATVQEQNTQNWLEPVTPAGSARYYALRFHPEQDRLRVQCVLALHQIWSETGFSDPASGAARLKLAWWHEELSQQRSRHPLSKILSQFEDASAPRATLLRILETYDGLLANGSPAETHSNKHFHEDTGGLLYDIIAGAETLATDNSKVASVTNRLGALLSQWRCLRHLRKHLQSGLLCLPTYALEQAGIEPQHLAEQPPRPEVIAFVRQQSIELAVALQKAATELCTAPDDSHQSLFIYARLQQALIESVSQQPTDIFAASTRLTPLRYTWLAFRASRECRRLQVR